jgi:pimeloyl-ACP methyl ester carboxylesterase
MKVMIGGRELSWTDTEGEGLPLVLLHGYPLDSTSWSGQSLDLADVARVIAPDLAGFGGTALPDGPVTIDGYALDVLHLLDHLKVGQAVVCGVSMGGYVALALQRQFPVRVRGLVLVDTRAGADSADAKAGRDEAIELARTGGAAAIADKMLPRLLSPSAPAAQVSALRGVIVRQRVEGLVAAVAAMRDRPDATGGLAAIDVPTLIAHGLEDTLIPFSEAEILLAGIKGADLAKIAGAAHLPNLERPDAFNAALREFLKRFES